MEGFGVGCHREEKPPGPIATLQRALKLGPNAEGETLEVLQTSALLDPDPARPGTEGLQGSFDGRSSLKVIKT